MNGGLMEDVNKDEVKDFYDKKVNFLIEFYKTEENDGNNKRRARGRCFFLTYFTKIDPEEIKRSLHINLNSIEKLKNPLKIQ